MSLKNWLCAASALAVACGSSGGEVPAGPQLGARSESSHANRPPVIREIRFDPSTPVRGDRIRAVVVAHDPDGDVTQIGYRWFVDGELISGGGSQLEHAELATGATVELVVVASDGHSESSERRASVVVEDRPPVMDGLSVQPSGAVYPGRAVVAEAHAHDPDGDSVKIEFEWFVNDERVFENESEFSSEGLHAGDEIHVRAVATARGVRSDPVESLRVTVGSAHPEFVSEPPPLRGDALFVYDVEVVDPDGDRLLRYRLDEAPEGMTVDDFSGRITWQPTVTDAGTHQVSVVVRDSSGLETKQSFYVTVNAVTESPPAAAAE